MDVETLKHKFEDGIHGIIIKTKVTVGVRHLQIIYMVVCTAVMGAMRGSSAVAVIAVADHSRQNDTYIQIHDWNSKVRGPILSAFLFGYALVLVPAEIYLKKLGDKSILTAVLLINGGICAAMPTVVNKGGWLAVCNAQFLMGMTQACVTPVNQMLLGKWLPPVERKVFSYLVHGGTMIGIIIALPISGMLSEARLGWELIFYTQAMMTLSMAAVWALLTASSPDHHQAVGDGEKEHIKQANSSCRKKPLRKPWRAILQSPQFWAVAGAHAACNAVFVFYLVEVPEYLMSLGFTLKESTRQCMFPFITMWLVYLTTAPAIDWIYRIGFVGVMFDLQHFRKIINTVGAFSTIIGLTVLPNLAWDWNHLGIVVLMGTLGSLGLQHSGFLENIREMTLFYSGSLLMLTSFVSGLAGAAVPFVCGLIIGDGAVVSFEFEVLGAPARARMQRYLLNSLPTIPKLTEIIKMDASRWTIVFYTMAAFCLSCNVIYIVFGNGGRQEWDCISRSKFGYNNDVSQVELEDRFDGDDETTIMSRKMENETAI